MAEKNQRGYVFAFRERQALMRALMSDSEQEVVQRLFMAAPVVWKEVQDLRHWAETVVKSGEYDTTIFHPENASVLYGFATMRQLRSELPSLRRAWNGIVRVQLCRAKQEGWYLIRLRAI